MSTVVDAASARDADGGDEESNARNPMDGGRIELSESEVRAASPAAWFAGVVSRLDDAATAFIYGRR
ncbi:hypothetical protein [Halopelagius fulvigenes]|uniref:Uncharacterized protein n=1 Tax=Halopelagius fulvigenes TaxID=1198324 RepID=A0ABD5U2V8_9EURY